MHDSVVRPRMRATREDMLMSPEAWKVMSERRVVGIIVCIVSYVVVGIVEASILFTERRRRVNAPIATS